MKFKIFGERNSNTNFLKQLIECNLKATTYGGTIDTGNILVDRIIRKSDILKDLYFMTGSLENTWKHSAFPKNYIIRAHNNTDMQFVSVTKHPYSWLVSMYRNPYAQISANISFEEFLTIKFPTSLRDNLQCGDLNVIQLWNEKNRSYCRLPLFGGVNLTFEELLFKPGEVIGRLSSQTGLAQPCSIIVPTAPIKANKKTRHDVIRYYQAEEWKEYWTSSCKNILNKHIDKTVVNYFGYSLD